MAVCYRSFLEDWVIPRLFSVNFNFILVSDIHFPILFTWECRPEEKQDIERFIYPQIGILPTIENRVNCSLHSGQRTMQVFSIEVEIQFNMVIGASLETKQRDKGLIIFFHIVEANSYCHQIIIHHFSKAVTTISSCQVSAIRRVGIK